MRQQCAQTHCTVLKVTAHCAQAHRAVLKHTALYLSPAHCTQHSAHCTHCTYVPKNAHHNNVNTILFPFFSTPKNQEAELVI